MWACFLIVCGAFIAPALAQEAEWRVGIAAVKITPEKPVVLAGYAARTKPFESIEQDIHAKALALKDASGESAVLVTMDLCTMPRDVAEEVRRRIAEKLNLPPAAVLISLSHTHSAPIVEIYANPQTDAQRNTTEYTRVLEEKLVNVAAEAFAALAPAKLSFGLGSANFVMNRRQFTDRGVILGVNPHGHVDRGVPVLRIDGPDGKPRAVLFGYACHNTTLPSRHLAVSGDYAGYAKAYVQHALPGVEAMFMMGCGGDANPYPREQVPAAPAHGEELGKEVCRVLETKLAPIHGPLNVAMETANLPLQTPDKASLEKAATAGAQIDRDTAKQMLAALDRDGKLPASYAVPVTAWQLGADLTLIALPDEDVVEYQQDLERALGPLRLWVAGYCHEVAGYIPSDRILKEGGYESRGLYYGTGWFAPGVESTLVEAATKAAEKAGRKAPSAP
jgi:hypothetical protein